jgi:acetyl esterase/lipase
MPSRVVVLIASLLQLPTSGAEVSRRVEVADRIVHNHAYPTAEVSFRGGVRGLPGLVYRRPLGYRPLALDLYLPPLTLDRPARGFPLVVYIHGGGWMSGDPRRSGAFVDFPEVLASLAARGYVVASISYRLSGEATFPAQGQDTKAAIRWLRSRATTYGIDPARAVTWGVSGGGHLAALAAVACNAPTLDPPRETPPPAAPDAPVDTDDGPEVSACVQGAVVWNGVFDMTTITDQARLDRALSREVPDAPEWKLLGCFGDDCPPAQLAAASPVNYLDPGDPPMLLIVGAEDRIVPPTQAVEMRERLKSADVPHDLLVIPGVDHLLIGETPEQTRAAHLEALEATFRFIEKTVGGGG